MRHHPPQGGDLYVSKAGVLSLSDPVDNVQLTQEEMNAIVSEAHSWNRKVAAHCHGDRAAKMAIAAGVDSIEHGSFLKDDTLQEMKKKHVYLVATLFAGVWVGQSLRSAVVSRFRTHSNPQRFFALATAHNVTIVRHAKTIRGCCVWQHAIFPMPPALEAVE